MNGWRSRVAALAHYDRVFFSPHLDDVGFSCPAALLAARAAGERVLVVSVFTEVGAATHNNHPGIAQLYEIRKGEELEAARRAGYDVLFGGLVDALYRHPDGRSSDFMGIMWTEESSERQALAEVVKLMAAVLNQTRPTEAYIPLGVGRHLDHRLLFEAYRHLLGATGGWDDPGAGYPLPEGLTIWCYEDRPYALVDQATKMRLRELGFPVRLDSHRFFASFWSTHYMQAMLTDPRHRLPCGARYMESIQCPVTARYAPACRVLTSNELPALWEIISAYRSQLADFVGDQRQFEWNGRLEARRRRTTALYAERQWNPQSRKDILAITRN